MTSHEITFHVSGERRDELFKIFKDCGMLLGFGELYQDGEAIRLATGVHGTMLVAEMLIRHEVDFIHRVLED